MHPRYEQPSRWRAALASSINGRANRKSQVQQHCSAKAYSSTTVVFSTTDGTAASVCAEQPNERQAFLYLRSTSASSDSRAWALLFLNRGHCRHLSRPHANGRHVAKTKKRVSLRLPLRGAHMLTTDSSTTDILLSMLHCISITYYSTVVLSTVVVVLYNTIIL